MEGILATVCQQLHVVISYYLRLWRVPFDHAWGNGYTIYTYTLYIARIMYIKYYIYVSVLEGWCHCRLKSSAYCCKFLQNNIKLLSQCIQYNIAYCRRALYPIIILIIPTAAVYRFSTIHRHTRPPRRANENTWSSLFFCCLLRDDSHNILICPAFSDQLGHP